MKQIFGLKTAFRLMLMIWFSAVGVVHHDGAWADIYWESEQIVSGEGWPTRRKTIRNYVTPEKSRKDIGENVMIADFKTMTGYVLNTTDKMFLQMQMNAVGKIPDGLHEEARVTPTDQYRNIAGYKCRRYRISYMEREYDEWLSTEVKAYPELKRIDDAIGGLVRQNPLFRMGIIGEMDKLNGFPVMTVMKYDDGRTKTITLKRVSQKKLDDKVFRVPKGFKTPH